MKNYLWLGSFVGVLVVILLSVDHVAAGSLSNSISAQLNAGAGNAGFETQNSTELRILLPSIFQVLFGFLATAYTIYLLLGGYWLLTARGQEEKISRAKDTIRRATIGLIVVMLAFSISSFIGSTLERSVQSGSTSQIRP